jgi:hypothetical protein
MPDLPASSSPVPGRPPGLFRLAFVGLVPDRDDGCRSTNARVSILDSDTQQWNMLLKNTSNTSTGIYNLVIFIVLLT